MPLLKDVTAAHLLDLNAAVRTHGLQHERQRHDVEGRLQLRAHRRPALPGHRCRVTFVRPTSTSCTRARTCSIPVAHRSVQARRAAHRDTQLTGGNPNLVPEHALSYTAGVVYQPAWATRPEACRPTTTRSICKDAISALTPGSRSSTAVIARVSRACVARSPAARGGVHQRLSRGHAAEHGRNEDEWYRPRVRLYA